MYDGKCVKNCTDNASIRCRYGEVAIHKHELKAAFKAFYDFRRARNESVSFVMINVGASFQYRLPRF